MFQQGGLFDGPAPLLPERFGQITPRDYQRQAYDEVFRVLDRGYRAPLGVIPTGGGKSVVISMLAGGLGPGRVMVVVDVGLLAMDLARQIHAVTGERVGILTGLVKEGYTRERIVVATVQSLYAGGVGTERFREYDAGQFSAILIDEAESAPAERFFETVNWFKANPKLVCCGFTATPVRSDGKGLGCVFDHFSEGEGPLNRDLRWGIREGWLVPMRQGFVRVNVDFSSLKIVRNEDGERDYSDADLARLFDAEEKFVELAHGIDAAAKGEPSIIICPNDVEFAKVLAHHLCAVARERCGLPDQAEAVYGKQGRRADDLLKRFKVGQFPYVVACKKLEKGFDADLVKHVFMVRKTKSQRVYIQCSGRGSRPLVEIRRAMDAAATAEQRRAIIAASGKSHVVIWDLVGISPDVKDMTLVDVLAGRDVPEGVRERAKRDMMASGESDVDGAVQQAKEEVDREAREAAERRERERRAAVRVNANVEIEVTGDLNAGGAGLFGQEPRVLRQPVTEPQLKLLIAYGISPEKAATFHRGQVQPIINGYRAKGRRPNWRLYDDYVNARNRRGGGAVGPEAMRPSQWQEGKLRQLNYAGPAPATMAAAKDLINRLESQRRGAVRR